MPVFQNPTLPIRCLYKNKSILVIYSRLAFNNYLNNNHCAKFWLYKNLWRHWRWPHNLALTGINNIHNHYVLCGFMTPIDVYLITTVKVHLSILSCKRTIGRRRRRRIQNVNVSYLSFMQKCPLLTREMKNTVIKTVSGEQYRMSVMQWTRKKNSSSTNCLS